MFKDLREKPQYEPTPEEIAELLSKILKGERRPLEEREVNFLASILGKGRELLREKLVKTGQLAKFIFINADHETKVRYAPLTAAQESSTIEEALTIILERLKTEGVENPIELLVKKVVRQRKHPNLSKNTLEIIERIKGISEEIADKIAEQLTEDKDRISKILEAFVYRFNRAVFGKAFNIGKKTPLDEKHIRSVLFNSIVAYVFDSDQEKCNTVVKGKEQTEDTAVLAILEFRRQFLARINEILG